MPLSEDVREANRARLQGLSSQTNRDVQALWPSLDLQSLDSSFVPWLVGVLAIIERDASRANVIAATYMQELRLALGVGTGPVIPGALVLERVESVMRISTVVAVKKATAAGAPLEVAGANALTMATGAATKLVLDVSRSSVTRSAVADPRSGGWRRIGRGACGFCAMLITRGAVYNEASVQFSSHARCQCTAEMVYQGRSAPYRPKNRSELVKRADNARLRQWLKDNPNSG